MGGPKNNGDLSVVPDALAQRTRVVQVEGGHVVVEKWTGQKLFQIMGLLADFLAARSVNELEAMKKAQPASAAVTLVKALGDRVVTFVQLSVSSEHRDSVPALVSEDFLDVLSAVVELNVTEKFIKKSFELVGMLRDRRELVSPSSPSKAPTGSSVAPA